MPADAIEQADPESQLHVAANDGVIPSLYVTRLDSEGVEFLMEPGDALFFHADTLHHWALDHGPEPRWAFISRHDLAWRNPYKESRRAWCTPPGRCGPSRASRKCAGARRDGGKVNLPVRGCHPDIQGPGRCRQDETSESNHDALEGVLAIEAR
jgi:hypothetical protein